MLVTTHVPPTLCYRSSVVSGAQPLSGHHLTPLVATGPSVFHAHTRGTSQPEFGGARWGGATPGDIIKSVGAARNPAGDVVRLLQPAGSKSTALPRAARDCKIITLFPDVDNFDQAPGGTVTIATSNLIVVMFVKKY